MNAHDNNNNNNNIIIMIITIIFIITMRKNLGSQTQGRLICAGLFVAFLLRYAKEGVSKVVYLENVLKILRNTSPISAVQQSFVKTDGLAKKVHRKFFTIIPSSDGRGCAKI
jgi:hypothetical protein